MTLLRRWITTVVLPIALAGLPACEQQPPEPEVGDEEPDERAAALRGLLDERAAGDVEAAREVARGFYQRRGYRAVWVAPDGGERGAELLEALVGVSGHGLDPERYDTARLRPRFAALSGETPAREAAAVELALTEAFFRMSADLLRGRIGPEAIGAAWHSKPREADLPSLLEEVAGGGKSAAAVVRLAPDHEGYRRLQVALGRYREVARRGGWTPIPAGPPLSEGDAADPHHLAALATRLAEEGIPPVETDAAPAGTAVYDRRLSSAVAAFQRLRGLEPSGRLGEETLRAFAVPADERVRQIELNLERWRWLPDDLGDLHVRVNVPSFELAVYRDGEAVLDMNVIVGRSGWGTPLFADRMTHVVLNPDWTVPQSIAVKDILPKLRRNPAYLEERHFELLPAGEGAPPPPRRIDWSQVTDDSFPWRLRQRPGPWNALGRIKFMFPNEHGVYLHDTPSEELFERTERALSHGCIRVERPIDLATALFRDDPQWSPDRFRATIESGAQRRVDLPNPVPVYLLYWTAFVNEDGQVEFHDDLYGLDESHARALRRGPGRQEAAVEGKTTQGRVTTPTDPRSPVTRIDGSYIASA